MRKTFEILRSKDNQFYFILVAGNGKVIIQSETYHNKKDCLKTINSIRRGAIFATVKDFSK